MSDDECVFCGDGRVTHQHHIIPKRYGGPDDEDNLLTLCPTCHAIIERLYDDEFYRAIGAKKIDEKAAEEQAILSAAREITKISRESIDEYQNSPASGEERSTRLAVLDTQTECLAAVVGLLDGYCVCRGCELPISEDPCPNCGLSDPGGEW